MRKKQCVVATVVLVIATGCQPGEAADGQDLHETKSAYAGAESWPGTSVDQVSLPGFHPFRAVYERFYTQGLGPGAGEPRQDWVVVTADYAAWDDKEAIVVSLYDSGNPVYSDTNGRVWTAYVGREDLALFLETGPVPGEAKEYYVWKHTEDGLTGGMLYVDREDAEFRSEDTALAPGLGIGPWAMASLPLSAGRQIRLDPFYGVASNVFSAAPSIVVGPASFEDPSGTVWETWMVDQLGNPNSSRVSRMHLVAEPPYLVARYSHDLETGEDSRGHRLVAFQLLEIPPTTASTAGR